MAPIIEGTNVLGIGRLGRATSKRCVAQYDASIDSKEVGTLTLRGDTLPKGAVIIDSLVHVQTKLESGGEATVLVTAETEGDVQASKKVSEAPWSTATPKRGAITATGTPVTTTAARNIVAKIGTAALTAGKFTVVVEYDDIAA
jgi:hypothetical protein